MIWILLGSIALLHCYWGLGGLWPGRSQLELAAMVIGDRPLPGRLACFAVALLLLLGPWYFRRLSALVFLLRGGLGFIEVHLRPGIRGTPYQGLNSWVYSPLSLLLAALLWA